MVIYKFFLLIIFNLIVLNSFSVAQTTDSIRQGTRAKWMKGAWGVLWAPEKFYNGKIEGVRIDDFLEQIKDLRTLDYVQILLTRGNIFSPVHTAPHKLLEKLWGGDRDSNGNIINLVVPREEVDDPFLSWLKAIKQAGLRVEVYVNSYNLLPRNGLDGVPEAFADIPKRWMTWCDTSKVAQEFLASKPYYLKGVTDSTNVWRPYMFCYAEFILKEYAQRYGDLIDAWCFDAASIMKQCGDDPTSTDIDDQRIYEAFANAVHSGNPNAAVAFNNGVGTAAKPFATPTYFEDYTFGHPFGGAGNMVETQSLYDRNFGICEFMSATGGYPFTNDNRDWNDSTVAHFFPKMSTTSWNSGTEPCLTDSQFVEWNKEGLIGGGAITWGTPLKYVNLQNPNYDLTLQDFALRQLKKVDSVLRVEQFKNNPNWARQFTVLTEAINYSPYYHKLVENIDFWDPEGDSIVSLTAINGPSWLKIYRESKGVWVLGGVPRETYQDTIIYFLLQVTDYKGNSESRGVSIYINSGNNALLNKDNGNGVPVWISDNIQLEATTHELFDYQLKRCQDFDDFDGDSLTITLIKAPSWISFKKNTSDIWQLSGICHVAGEHNVYLELSDGEHSVNSVVTITVKDPQFLSMINRTINGSAYWEYSSSTGEYVYNNGKKNYDYRAILYSAESFHTTHGFKLTIVYTTGNIGAILGHNFSFGLISDEIDLSSYTGFNPFGREDSIYSIGINVTANEGEDKQGLNFTNYGTIINLDQSGDNVQFATDVPTEVVFEIDSVGNWKYFIGGVEESSGKLDNFDITKSYRVAIYGQDDDGGGKSIQKIALSTNPYGPMSVTLLSENNSILWDNSVVFYPNPVINRLNYKFNDLNEINSLEIYSINGNLVLAREIKDITGTIDITKLSKGIYFVKLIYNNRIKFKRFVK